MPTPLTYLVKQLQDAMRAQLEAITRDAGLTLRQYTTLSVLRRHRGISSAGLARLTFVTPQAANEMVATLENKGFLTRSVPSEDRRRLAVALSKAGTATLARCDAQVDRLEARILRGVPSADRTAFRRTLRRCIENLGQQSQEATGAASPSNASHSSR